MYNELIEALRKHANWIDACSCTRQAPTLACDWARHMRDAADAIERLVEDIGEKDRILKAVQENSGINFRMWQEAEAVKADLIRRICSRCDSRLAGCEDCPIIEDINKAFDEVENESSV